MMIATNYCPFCDKPLEAQRTTFCPKCSYELTRMMSCPSCGVRYDEWTVTPPVEVLDPAPDDERAQLGEALNETALQIIRDMWNNEVGSGSDMDWHLKQEGYTERMKNLLAVVDVIEGKNET